MADGSGGSGSSGGSSDVLSWPEESDAARTAPTSRPRQTFVAILLLWVGAGATALAVVQAVYVRFFAPDSQVREQIVSALKQTEQKVNEETIAAMESALTSMVVVNFVALGGWILMAIMVGRGVGWARMVATVLAILNVPWTMFMAPDLVHLVGVVAGLAAVLFLWMPASREWFAARGGRT